MYEVKVFETAAVSEVIGQDKYLVKYISVSSLNWAVLEERAGTFLPLNSGSADLIREKLNEGKDVYIDKKWNDNDESEVMPYFITTNNITDLEGYKRRAMSFVSRSMHPQMAKVNAAVIYGFNVINNKFLEAGIVFSEENRSLKYIEVIEKADILEEEKPEIAEELMLLLERYIEYREILDRSYFAWELNESYLTKIEEQKTKEDVDTVIKDFITQVDTLNNLK